MGSITTITSPKTFMLTESHSFLSPGGTLLQLIVLPTRMHFLRVISKYLTVQVMWKVPAWELTLELPQQTATNRIASQSVFT